MNSIAFLYGDTLIYWSAVVLSMAAAVGIMFFLSAWLCGNEGLLGAAVACPMAIVLSLILGRLIHWYFLPDGYESIAVAMTTLSSGGYALVGAFAGCLLTALILRLAGAVKNLPFMLDCMSFGGCGAIALGRLSCFFTSENRGQILTGVTKLPWVYPVVNPTSGVTEYRLAVFFFQALIVGCLFGILWHLFRRKHRDGDITLLFLLFYCASQIVLDSARYDCLRLRSNGFISVVQILCAVTLVAVLGVFTARMRKKSGWKLLTWLLTALAMSGAGYMEYYVQRHGDRAGFAYLTMSGCLSIIVLLGLGLWWETNRRKPRFARA